MILFWRTKRWADSYRRYGRRWATGKELGTSLKYDLQDILIFTLALVGLSLQKHLLTANDEIERLRRELGAARRRNSELGQRFDAYRSSRAGRQVIGDGPGRATFPLRAPAFPL
ncbi:hypothetical protein [Caulobacter segnis]|uniref:Uncharacterized protein n=1 Tax=Caulobacter segnis TaxID=88688 RepID=A0A2W5V8F5_9CAUL|nr:hypothetical protein [Caulobacter segnis]PZR36060.1 MAG: hypothetical protein DI526_04630 [Caulobacter segnis]